MKVIARIKGGLGNQLFCYAAARRMALINHAELVIDDVTGFIRDRQYRRKYALDRFTISAKKATAFERMEPFERYRRGLAKYIARRGPFHLRRYVEQEIEGFDERLLALKVRGSIYLDGYWQSENYFKDMEQTIREDLRIIPPTDALNQQIAQQIRGCNAVALHVRWFNAPNDISPNIISTDYYRQAISLIEEKIESPHYFLFSDDPEAAGAKLSLPTGRVTFVSHNRGDQNAYADLWLMTLCHHFIIANSTFSWWGAWLGESADKLVIAPGTKINASVTKWGFKGLIPSRWIEV